MSRGRAGGRKQLELSLPSREIFVNDLTLFGERENKLAMVNFSSSVQAWVCGPRQGFISSEIHLDCHFKQVGIKAEKFEF